MFIAEIRDLDASLLGEKNLKARYYTLMLADADKFLADYRLKLASTPTAVPPGSASGGYVGYGVRLLGEQGREFVLSNSTTKAAEEYIGRGLSQDSILSALVRGSGNSRNVTYNDQRRFNATVPLSERRAIAKETAELITTTLLR